MVYDPTHEHIMLVVEHEVFACHQRILVHIFSIFLNNEHFPI
jgi:hypothetical protein